MCAAKTPRYMLSTETFGIKYERLIKTKGEREVDEGCLSFPNQFGKVIRPKEVTVEALDLDGNKVKLVGKDLLAQAICHELDHLEGMLFTDRIDPKNPFKGKDIYRSI